MESSPTFEQFIDNKPLYYKEIDHKRVHNAYALLKPYIKRPLTIHIVGTNGKGSTGRIMATLLNKIGKRVGHFSSPHILKFNERIWLSGQDISDKELEVAHLKLYALLGQEMSDSLSYFEYTTLLSLVATEDMDVMILEAGLGGEFDATNVVNKELSVITPIGLDHQDFLGETITEIALTKLNSIQNQALIARQPYQEVYKVAEDIGFEKKANILSVSSEENLEILSITQTLGWAYYLYENALLATKALNILGFSYRVNDLKEVTLFGRFYSLFPNVKIDVGHNLLAGKALEKALKNKYNSEKIILVYNSLNDKDYEGILRLFKPLLKRVEIIEIESSRTVETGKLKEVLERLEIEYQEFSSIKSELNYFVFGSFYVVEAFLKKIKFNIKNQK